MEKAVVSFSFDDGRGDNYRLIKKIMMQHNIPVTLNVTTGYIDGSSTPSLKPSEKQAMTKKQVIELSRMPLVEIALHGDNHLNTETDLMAGMKKLTEWIGTPSGGKWGFASPGCDMPVEQFLNSESPFFKKDILYMRTGLRIEHFDALRVLCRKAGRVIHLPILYKIAYYDTIMKDCKDRVIYSVPVLKDISFYQVKGIVDLAIRHKGAVTLMFHSIEPDAESKDNWSWDTVKFKKLCSYLIKCRDQKKIDIVTTRKLYEILMLQ